jgi:hypothetical protein
MFKEILLENEAVTLSIALTMLIVFARIYFLQMEMRQLGPFDREPKASSKKPKHTSKRTTYADAA